MKHYLTQNMTSGYPTKWYQVWKLLRAIWWIVKGRKPSLCVIVAYGRGREAHASGYSDPLLTAMQAEQWRIRHFVGLAEANRIARAKLDEDIFKLGAAE